LRADVNDWSAVALLLYVIAIIGVVTLIATKQWLRAGPVSAALYAVAGCAIVLLMYFHDIPPWWFDGGKGGFGLCAMLLASAFVLSSRSERAFGRPLLLGMGVTLLVLNIAAHV
jgi:peptidoglycan/LPS O-acetylase OafA/YrhL